MSPRCRRERSARSPTLTRRTLRGEPYAEKKTPWKSYLFLLLLLGAIAFLWHRGHLQEWWGQWRAKDSAPAAAAPATPPPATNK